MFQWFVRKQIEIRPKNPVIGDLQMFGTVQHKLVVTATVWRHYSVKDKKALEPGLSTSRVLTAPVVHTDST